jgi:3-hydroxyisobutyrate dehydrogenase-like beta-hydroxyacid dehydrogenase
MHDRRVMAPHRTRKKGLLMTGKVGVLGLGIMGGAISANLVARGWSVVGYDPDSARAAEAAAAGVRTVATIADVAREAPFIITSLPTPAIAASVARELADSGAPPRIVIEASTLRLEDKTAFHDILAAAGHIALDCPLSGTGAQARNRDLVVYASGDATSIAKAMPLFGDFARQAVDLGAFGNGSKMKFVANLLVAIHNVAAAEAMVLGVRAGLDPRQLVEVAGAGAGGSRMFDMRAPMMAAGVYEPATMRISTWQKDMSIISEFARAFGAPTPLLDATAPLYTQAYESGLGAQDTAAVCKVLERMAGLPD